MQKIIPYLWYDNEALEADNLKFSSISAGPFFKFNQSIS